MGLSRVSGLQTDLELLSVWPFLHITAEMIHKDDGMTGSQGLPASTKTCCGSSLRELFGENIGGRHHIQYRAVAVEGIAALLNVGREALCPELTERMRVI